MNVINLKNKKLKKAFTLAEVLITLVIIGIVAAMTIPTLINNSNKQEYVSKLKKTYSALAQVTNQVVSEHGSPKNWVTSVDYVYGLYKSKLVNVKDCGGNSGCFNQSIKYLNGGHFGNSWNGASYHKKLILNDGTQLLIGGGTSDFSSDCSVLSLGKTQNICQVFYVDINGEKNPNQWGRDIFGFVLTENGLFPDGIENSEDCIPTSTGLSCAAKVLRENAMNY